MNGRSLVAVWSLVLTLVLTLAASSGGPAAAQDTEPADGRPEVRLVVTGLSRVLGPGILPSDASDERAQAAERVTVRALVENTGSVRVGDLRLSVEIYEAVGFRSTLRTALDLDDP
ncbi:MAG TPA: hypothetical protein VGA69_10055, partial [Nitriliruptorales bacterium]